jgi:predicted nucleic acid-binding protein
VIYLDTVIVAYAVEACDSRGERTRQALPSAEEPLCYSPLVEMECMVEPYRRGDQIAQQRLHRFFAGLSMLDITSEVFDRAAHVRAATGLRAMDALHMATAMVGGCSALWTVDKEFAHRSGGFAVDILADE